MNWAKPRIICVVVDNESWVLPYTEQIIRLLNEGGDTATLVQSHDDIPEGDVAFYLGCVKITPPDVLARMYKNIVVHASDLPKGKGFAPMAWQILEGKNDVAICLIEMANEVDSGPVVYRDTIHLEGHELYNEWRELLGKKIIEMCLRYLNESSVPEGTHQSGQPTLYARRRPSDSKLDPQLTIASQFDLLRIVDNENYPAFFEHRGKKYQITIKKVPE